MSWRWDVANEEGGREREGRRRGYIALDSDGRDGGKGKGMSVMHKRGKGWER